MLLIRILQLLALGPSFASLSWDQIANLRDRYRRSHGDHLGRLDYLRQWLRNRIWARLVAFPSFSGLLIGFIALALREDRASLAEPLAWVAGLVVALGWLGAARMFRDFPRHVRGEGVEASERVVKTCENFEWLVGELRSRAPEHFRQLCYRGDATATLQQAQEATNDRRSPIFEFCAAPFDGYRVSPEAIELAREFDEISGIGAAQG